MTRVLISKIPSRWQWAYAVALAATIVWASGNGQVAATSIVNFDKVAHFSVFGLMATLVLRPFRGGHAWWAVVIVSLFGVSDELRQSLTPGRSMELADWIADTIGAVVAVTVYTFWPWYRRLLETPLWKRKPKIEAVLVSAKTVSAL
ncbi:VanZ family protein [Rariglobus hedericola]|uniref:VanZ family protein n=2 Tax=Rariglobus hedericola TaxID=2597822 RepID=A0A556QSZ9_9BACT|nr:VanZ family protein [Rariglobus hedericola]